MPDNLKLLLISSENESLLLVLQNDNIFVAGCLLQHHSDVIYIEALDTTGYFTPRDHQKDIVYSLISHVCNMDCSLISVFSVPKKETLFGKSELNTLKGFYSARKLESFWVNHFKSLNKGKIHVYSNFTKEKSIPYKFIEQIRIFDDDPKRKTQVDEPEINTFYQSLLHRADFIKGSLVYLEKKKIDSNPEKCDFDDNSFVRRAVSFLRGCDFSDLESGKRSTLSFLKMFYYENIEFQVYKCKNVSEIEEKIILMTPIRKNK